ncbi:SDR family oxidoreductase [bacterium]|nr:SDR family oxidoreductase [bacterium]
MKTVLVTGGSRGIGKAIANYFTAKNYQVYSPSHRDLDLSKSVELPSTDFDIVVNCAGINPLRSISEIKDETVMQVNYYAPLKIVQQCLPHMVKQGYGRIINIGSIWIDKAKSQRLAYSASKSALHSLTKSIAAEYSQYNILANTISPGFIDTELTHQNNTEQQIRELINNVPLGRLGTTDEVARLVYQLTVDNSFITGQNIIIDGGYTCIMN